ncbi:PASTA domain-containing protein [Sphaerisporangium perillae]|uniref:PASTA domain-containing protein n=1 Tax=Sphaerisporangium perillae TaxID=2935860 RepID=UPI00200F2067|nr:PASTA domain-containing protein [Sphaerisporangium perillae]
MARDTLLSVPDADIDIQVIPQTLLPTSMSYVIDYVVENCSADHGIAIQDDVVYTVILEVGPKVPDVQGLSRADAETDLDAAGLGKDPQPASASADWKVDGQDPPAGKLVSFGTTVRLDLVPPNPPSPKITTPAPPQGKPQVTVPPLIGLGPAAARRQLSEVGLVLRVDPDSPETGEISSQDPAAGSQVSEGATVTVSLQEAVTEAPNRGGGGGGGKTGPGKISTNDSGSSSPLVPTGLLGVVLVGVALALVLVARTLRARRTVPTSDPHQAQFQSPSQTKPYPQFPSQTQPQQVPSIHCDPQPDPAPRLEIHLTGSPSHGAAPSAPVPDIRVELFADPGRQELREVVS